MKTRNALAGASIVTLIAASGSAVALSPGSLNLGPFSNVMGALVYGHVANNAAMEHMIPIIGRVHRDGFASAGDGGGGDYTLRFGPCPLNGGAGDGGSQVPLATGCAMLDKSQDLNQHVFGVDCSGATDSTAQVQAMWTAAVARQVQIDHKSCIAQTTAPIVVNGRVVTAGIASQMTPYTNVVADPAPHGGGAWYYLNHTGQGFVINAPGGNTGGNFGYGNQLRGFGTYRAQPGIATSGAQNGVVKSGSNAITGLTNTSNLAVYDTVSGAGIPAAAFIASIPSSTSIVFATSPFATATSATASATTTITTTRFTPCACDYDIVLNYAEAKINVAMLNPTKAILLNNAGKTNIEEWWGQSLGMGIDALSSYDNPYMGIYHNWTFWSNKPEVLMYTALNATCLHVGRADGLYIKSMFCFNQWKGLDIDTYAGSGGNQPGGTAYGVSIGRLYGDSTSYTVYYEPGVTGSTVHIGELTSQPSVQLARSGFASAGVTMSNVTNNTLTFDFGYFDYSGGAHVYASGAGNVIHGNHAFVGSYGYAFGHTDAAFNAITGSRVQLDDYSPTVDIGTPPGPMFAGNAYRGAQASGRDLLVNAGFSVNQRGYVSGTSLAGVNSTFTTGFGHDHWYNPGAAATYTFAQANTDENTNGYAPDTIYSIPAGANLDQKIEARAIRGGYYTASWGGSAPLKIFYVDASNTVHVQRSGSSPLTVTLPAGVTPILQFGTGTLVRPKFEAGQFQTAPDIKAPAVELTGCQRYFQMPGILPGFVLNSTTAAFYTSFKVSMRVAPTNATLLRTDPRIESPPLTAGFTGSGSSARANYITPETYQFTVDGFTGLTPNTPTALLPNQVAFSAEF